MLLGFALVLNNLLNNTFLASLRMQELYREAIFTPHETRGLYFLSFFFLKNV